MEPSILLSVKKNLSLQPDYEVFDGEIITHINTAFFTLTQLGVIPEGGFSIEDAETTWDDVLGLGNELKAVKTYIYLRVRILFDPPATSYTLTSFEKQISELEWRLNAQREDAEWVEPKAAR